MVEPIKFEPAAAILTLSIKGFYQLDELQLYRFFVEVLPRVRDFLTMEEHDESLYTNRMGSQLIATHGDFERLAKSALKINDYFEHNEYANVEILRNSNLRVRAALNWGEVPLVNDVIQHRTCLYGKNMELTTIIEAVTPWGHIWATDSIKSAIIERYERLDKLEAFDFTPLKKMQMPGVVEPVAIWEITHEGQGPTADAIVEDGTAGTYETECLPRINSIVSGTGYETTFRQCCIQEGECPLPPKSLCLAAELVRNVEAMCETKEFIDKCDRLWLVVHQTKEIFDTKRHDIEEAYSLIGNMRRTVNQVLDFFVTLERNYPPTQDWSKKMDPEKLSSERLREFITLRLSLKYADSIRFQKALIQIHKMLNELRENAPDDSCGKLQDSSAFNDALADFHELYREAIRAHLADLYHVRRSDTKKAILRNLSDFDCRKLDEHLENCLRELPHNLQPRPIAPRIWPLE